MGCVRFLQMLAPAKTSCTPQLLLHFIIVFFFYLFAILLVTVFASLWILLLALKLWSAVYYHTSMHVFACMLWRMCLDLVKTLSAFSVPLVPHFAQLLSFFFFYFWTADFGILEGLTWEGVEISILYKPEELRLLATTWL